MSESTELELQRGLGRLEGKVDALIHEVRSANTVSTRDHELLKEEHEALRARVSRLERWRVRLIAWVAGAVAVAGVVGWLFHNLILFLN